MRFLALSLVSAVTALAVGGAAAASLSPIGCGSVITQDTRLTANLRGCTDGLTVAGDGITLNLNGHTISGTGSSSGINVTGQEVTVKNGIVTAFNYGVVAVGDAGTLPRPSVHLQSVKLTGNTVGVYLDTLGINRAPSSIESSQIVGNATYGAFVAFSALTVTNSSIRANGSNGVHEIEALPLLTNNDISQNGGDGVFADDIYTFPGSGLFGNTLNGNGRDGFAYGQIYPDAYPHLENNRADRNGQLGFRLGGSGGSLANLDGGGNSAKLNGDARQCLVEDSVQPVPPDALVCSKTPGSN